MTLAALTAPLSDLQVLALTAWAEARGDSGDGSSVEERLAVMQVCVTRARDPQHRWPRTVKAVCLQPQQFSCWLPGADANHRALVALAAQVAGQADSDPLWRETLFLAGGVLTGAILDRTGGATHYYAPRGMQPPGRVPTWAVGKPYREIGSQRFLRA